MSIGPLAERALERIREWGVTVDETLETPSSWLAFGRRGDRPVVLKVVRRPGDEWRSGEVLELFDGKGVARVYEFIEGAVLLERLEPGTTLTSLALNQRDDEATEILASIIGQMSHPRESAAAFVTVKEWGQGFERYLASGDVQIPRALVAEAQRLYARLSNSQRAVRLLHGDLQHYNVLFDGARGWLAIDPKGVIGEVEYEIGAALRNPYERPELFSRQETVARRIERYRSSLNLDPERVLAWGFAQAVLSAIWSVEDGFTVDEQNPSLMLAQTIRPMLR